jgi:NAD(P)-dependent dehydrogenase (short-subunit alcohol dehydrogenase family)
MGGVVGEFSGKTVLVTGGGAGIGRATLEAFAAQGAAIVCIEIDPARAAAVRDALRHHPQEVLIEEGDITVPGQPAQLAARVQARFGRLDVLVNNCGDFLNLAKPFEAFSDTEIDRLYAINLRQVFDTTRAMLPLLRNASAGAAIVNISSIEAFRGIPNCTVYGTFKAALTGFTQSLALELGPHNIRVNAIAPETTETPQVPASLVIAPEHREHVRRWIPLGRHGTPRDMADAILFLASPRAAWITGTTLHVDGGALAAAGWYRDPRDIWTNMPVITGNGMNL